MRKLLTVLFAAFSLATQAQTLVRPLNGGTGIANANANTLTISAASTVSGTNTGDNAINSLYSGLVTMTYPGAGIPLSTGSAWGTSITNSSANWNTAYTERAQWDGGSTNLVAATGRTSLGLGTAATTASTAYDVAGAAAAVTPTTLALAIGTNTQAYSAKLGIFSVLVDAAGWLHSTGAGVYAWSAPTAADVGALAVGATAVDSSKLGGSLPAAYALTAQTMNIGTTAVAINRASAALVLTGITSIDGSSASTTGNAATATKSTNLIGGNGTTLLGAVPYQSGTDATTFVVNTTSTKKFLRETGTGTNGAAPAWDTIIAGDVPTLNQSTTGSAATLTTTRAIYGNNFDGSAALTQVIGSAYGGTGNGWTKFSGPTTAEKTFTLPDANATILYAGGALGTPSSGVGTNITNVNAATLGGATFAAPGAIGGTTPGSGAFTTITSNNIASLTTAAESWIGPSSTAGVYFKGGNVGIGTTAPGTKLTVWQSSDALTGGISVVNNTLSQSTYEWMDSASVFHIDNGSTGSRNIVLNGSGTGNVGIGTTIPGSSSGGDSGARLELLTSGAAGAAGNGALRWYGNNSNYIGWIAKADAVIDTNVFGGARLSFTTPDASGNPLQTLTMKAGNVGIGTTPGFLLEVAGSAAVTTLLGRTTTSNANDTLLLGTNAQNFFIDRPGAASVSNQIIAGYNTAKPATVFQPFQVYNNLTDHNQMLVVQSKGSSSGADAVLLVPASGNVGIGTITPAAKLAINGGLHVGGDSDPGDNNALIDGTLGVTGVIAAGSTVNLKNYTVATLPAGVRGDIAYVTDALAPTYLVAVAGGGAIVTPVFRNATVWVAY
jgi:hypothetical protein